MVLTREDMRAISKMMESNMRKISREIRSMNSYTGLTYNELSDNIAQISGDDYNRDFKIERIE